MSLPKELRYKEYVWAKIEGNKASLGVTDYALENTKEIVFIDLPDMGKSLNKGDDFVSLESVKWSGHMASPLSGDVIEVNGTLFDDPSKLNKDPYGSWICKIKLSKPNEAKDMLDSDSAEEWVKENLG